MSTGLTDSVLCVLELLKKNCTGFYFLSSGILSIVILSDGILSRGSLSSVLFSKGILFQGNLLCVLFVQ